MMALHAALEAVVRRVAFFILTNAQNILHSLSWAVKSQVQKVHEFEHFVKILLAGASASLGTAVGLFCSERPRTSSCLERSCRRLPCRTARAGSRSRAVLKS